MTRPLEAAVVSEILDFRRGYRDFLEAITEPNQQEHAEKLEWIGHDFDPKAPRLRHSPQAVHGLEPSVGSVGDSYDNALAETINGLYKAEVIHRRGPWRSFEAVEFATLEWVDWFNHRRLLEPIGNIPPAEAEQRYYAMMEQIPMAA